MACQNRMMQNVSGSAFKFAAGLGGLLRRRAAHLMSSTVSEAAGQLGAYAGGAIGAFFLGGEIVGSWVGYNIEKPFKAGFDAVREAGHNLHSLQRRW